jgi:uncharacterized membrane protein
MNALHFPEPYQHRHPPVREVNEILQQRQSLSQRAADWVAVIVGSWRFLIIQSFLLTGWFVVNSMSRFSRWDPTPSSS